MAKNDEVAHSFQSLMGAHGGQVADPVIEAYDWPDQGRGEPSICPPADCQVPGSVEFRTRSQRL